MGTSGTNTVNLFVVTAGSVKNGKILAKTVCRIYKVTRLGDLSPIGRLSKTLAIDFFDQSSPNIWQFNVSFDQTV